MLNNVQIMGRLTSTPELRSTPANNSVTTFCVAVQRSYVKQGEERAVDFIDCVAWKQTAEYICRFFKKGQGIVLEGTLQTRMYTDKTGNNRKAVEVVVNHAWWSIQNSDAGEQPQTRYADTELTPISPDDEDLPF